MSDELKLKIEEINLKEIIEHINNGFSFPGDSRTPKMALIIEELTIREAKLTAENEELKGQNERLERKKDDYPNVLAKIFNDLEFVRKTAMEREAKLIDCVKFYAQAERDEILVDFYESEDINNDLDIGKKARVTLSELNIKEGV